ncbi:MAG: rod shape-determining protein RodA [Gracilibacteraceae bacterium]|jgi:rod shape determining protein RodA|nr:rod shape-determining protein RodA [Gracilibacteraceae bacterium]
MSKVWRKWVAYVDVPLLGLLLLILAASLFVLSTAAYSLVPGDPYYYVKTNAVWMVAGLGLALTVACVDYKHTRYAYGALYVLNVVMLLLVLFLGVSSRGAQRWLEVWGGIAFQPSEFAKIIVVVSLACFLARRPKGLGRYKDFVVPFLFVLLPMALVFAQPDLGTSLVFLAIFAGMMFAAGAHPIKFASVFVGVAVVGVAVVYLSLAAPESLPVLLKPLAHVPLPLHDYQIGRILVFLNPEVDVAGEGYQVMQSLWAIGSGGLWGKGYQMGTQSQHNFVPDNHTDFVFSVVGEEFGFLGTSILLILFCGFLLRCVSVAMKSRDLLGLLIVAGLVSMWAFQFVVNVGMASGMMPVTGMPLPFMTSGGSSMGANLVGAGLVFGVYARRERTMF